MLGNHIGRSPIFCNRTKLFQNGDLREKEFVLADDIKVPVLKNYATQRISVFGAAGSGKSTHFIFPNIYRMIAREESIVAIDEAETMLKNTADLLYERGYKTQTYNASNPNWDAVRELWQLVSDPGFTNEHELTSRAYFIAETLVKNVNTFGEMAMTIEGAKNMIASVIIYIVSQENDYSHDLPGVVKAMTTIEYGEIDRLIEASNVRKRITTIMAYFRIYSALDETSKARATSIAYAAIRAFTYDENKIDESIRVSELSEQKCAYYATAKNWDSEERIRLALFFSMVLYELMHKEQYDVFTNVIVDASNSVGYINGLPKIYKDSKLKKVRIISVWQTLGQLKLSYAEDFEWNDIIAGSLTKIGLGFGDIETAEIFAAARGDSGNVNELMRMDKENCIVCSNGEWVMTRKCLAHM